MDQISYIFFWICLSLVLCCTGCCTYSYFRRRANIEDDIQIRNQVFTPQELYRVQIRTV